MCDFRHDSSAQSKNQLLYDRNKNHFYLDDVHNIVTHTQFFIYALPFASFFFPSSASNLRTDVARNIFLRCQQLFLLTYNFMLMLKVNHGRFMLYNLFEIRFYVIYTPSFIENLFTQYFPSYRTSRKHLFGGENLFSLPFHLIYDF